MATPGDPDRGGAERFGVRHTDLARVVSALVMAPLAILTAYVGGWLFTLFWAGAALGVVAEWMLIVDRPRARLPLTLAGLVLVVAVALIGTNHPVIAIGAIVLGAGAVAVPASPGRRGWMAAGLVYAGALLVAPVVLRADPEWGFLAILILFATVWASDVAAYFGGRTLQGPKLWPRISPKKTWSGAVIGTVAAMAAAVMVAKLGGTGHLWPIAVVAAGLSVIGQVGDLLESGVKRRFGVKDASHVIPGHGGIMDRVDAFLTASVAAALLGCLRGGLSAPGHGLLLW